MIARVEPLTTTRRLSGPFDYLLPADPVGVGSIVRIPFGRQALDGVVVELADATEVPDEKLVTPTGGARRVGAGRAGGAGAVDGARVLLDAGARAVARAAAARARAHAAVGRAHREPSSTASG